jgi:hypothetical protein
VGASETDDERQRRTKGETSMSTPDLILSLNEDFDAAARDTTSPWLPTWPPVPDTEASESRGVPDSLRVAGPGDGIANTLAERQRNYGDFSDNAEYAQQIKDVLHGGISWADMPYHMQEALDLIASKIARMLSGDPMYRDSWHDIVGYATLVEQQLTK